MTVPGTRRPVMLDTDIGSDVDDLLALAVLARAPELELVGVTTVYGDTTARARITRHVLNLLRQPSVPIGIGASETLTGRPVWWAGHEGLGLPDLDRVALDTSQTAAVLLRQTAREHQGALELFAIGPLTNVAEALTADDVFATSLRHLYIMGGAFSTERPEHNIKSDPEAAAIVFRAGIPVTVCGLDVTERVWLREPDLAQVQAGDSGIGPLLADQVRRWWDYIGANANNLHDPVAILSGLRPELFRFERCDVRVELDGAAPGRTVAERCGAGSALIAVDIEVETAEQEILQRLVPPS